MSWLKYRCQQMWYLCYLHLKSGIGARERRTAPVVSAHGGREISHWGQPEQLSETPSPKSSKQSWGWTLPCSQLPQVRVSFVKWSLLLPVFLSPTAFVIMLWNKDTRILEILQKIMISYLILNSDGFMSHSRVFPLNFCIIGKLIRDLLGT